jgi:hypothetical protein
VVGHRRTEEHPDHVRLHGVLQPADAITDAITDGGVFLHAEEHFAVQRAPAGDREDGEDAPKRGTKGKSIAHERRR